MSWAAVAVGAGSLVGGYMAGQGGSGGSTTVAQNSSPWVDQEDYLRDVFRSGASLFRDPRSILAAQSPATLNALGMQEQRAMAGSPLIDAAQQGNLATLRGDFLSADSNPYLRGAVGNALNDAKMQVNSQFNGDNFGGSAHQEWLGRTMADRALPIYAQNYENERGRQMNASAMAPGLAAQDYLDIGQLSAVGGARDARAQQVTDEPFTRLQRYQGQVGGAMYGGQSSAQTPYFTNPMASALGMGLGGLQMYNAFNQGGMFGQNQATPTNNFAYNGMGFGGYQYG